MRAYSPMYIYIYFTCECTAQNNINSHICFLNRFGIYLERYAVVVFLVCKFWNWFYVVGCAKNAKGNVLYTDNFLTFGALLRAYGLRKTSHEVCVCVSVLLTQWCVG